VPGVAGGKSGDTAPDLFLRRDPDEGGGLVRGSDMVEELKASGALDALFARIDAGEIELTGDTGLILGPVWRRLSVVCGPSSVTIRAVTGARRRRCSRTRATARPRRRWPRRSETSRSSLARDRGHLDPGDRPGLRGAPDPGREAVRELQGPQDSRGHTQTDLPGRTTAQYLRSRQTVVSGFWPARGLTNSSGSDLPPRPSEVKRCLQHRIQTRRRPGRPTPNLELPAPSVVSSPVRSVLRLFQIKRRSHATFIRSMTRLPDLPWRISPIKAG
jgi:hypothetical protein